MPAPPSRPAGGRLRAGVAALAFLLAPGPVFAAAAPTQPPEQEPPPEGGHPSKETPPEGEGAPPEGEEAAPKGEEAPPEGEEGETGDGEDSGSTPGADLAAPPVGILPGRLLASPAPVPGSPVVGLVFGERGFVVRTAGGQVVAYEPDGGRARWGAPDAGAVFLAASGGRLVILDENGGVSLRSLADGVPKGGFSTGLAPDRPRNGGSENPVPAPAAFSGGMLFWVSGGSLHGWETASGSRILEAPLPGASASAVAAVPAPGAKAPPLLLVSLGDGGLAAIGTVRWAATGTPRWIAASTGRVTGPALALPEQRLAVFGDAGGDLHALDLQTGRRRWRWRLLEGMHHPPLESRGRLYAATKANSLYCYDAGRGGERWRTALPGRPAAPPLRVAGALVVVTRDGLVTEFNAETGMQIGRPADLEAEVVGVVRRRGDGAREDGWRDRRLFLGLRDGRLAVFGPAGASEEGSSGE